MLSVFYFVIFLAIVFFELTRKKQRLFDYLTFFNIYFVGFYLFPAFVINCSLIDYTSRYSRYLENIQGTLHAAILILFSYIMVVIGYIFTKRKSRKKITVEIKNETLVFRRVNYALIIIGLISLIIYGGMFGGVKRLLLYAGSIRGGLIVADGDSNIEFIGRFIAALMYPSYFIFSRYLKTKKGKIKLIISFAFAALWLIVHAGRGAVLEYILVLYLTYMLVENKKIDPIKIIGLFAVIFIGINYLRPIFTNLMYLQDSFGVFWNKFINESTSGRYAVNGIQDVFLKLSYYLDYKYVSLEVAIQAVNSGVHRINFFFEIFIALISIIPSKFLFFTKPASITFYNTLYITGIHESKMQIPSGGIALGYYSLSWVGVILFSLLVGVIGKKLNNLFYEVKQLFCRYTLCCNNVCLVKYFLLWRFKADVAKIYYLYCYTCVSID